MGRSLRQLLLAVLIAASWSSASATFITIRFTADVISVDSHLASAIAVGDELVGFMSYDTDQTNIYFYPVPLAFSYTVGAVSASSTMGWFRLSGGTYNPFVNNMNPGNDLTGTSINGYVPLLVGLAIFSDTAFTEAVLLNPPDLSIYTNPNNRVDLAYILPGERWGVDVGTRLTSLTIYNPVSEPPVVLLVALSLLLLAKFRRPRLLPSLPR